MSAFDYRLYLACTMIQYLYQQINSTCRLSTVRLYCWVYSVFMYWRWGTNLINWHGAGNITIVPWSLLGNNIFAKCLWNNKHLSTTIQLYTSNTSTHKIPTSIYSFEYKYEYLHEYDPYCEKWVILEMLHLFERLFDHSRRRIYKKIKAYKYLYCTSTSIVAISLVVLKWVILIKSWPNMEMTASFGRLIKRGGCDDIHTELWPCLGYLTLQQSQNQVSASLATH